MRALLIAPLLLLVACGSDDGGGGDGDAGAFCEQISILQTTTAPDEDINLDQFDALIDVAPSEVSDELGLLRDVFVQIEEAGDDEDALAAVFALIGDPEFEQANITLNEYVLDECGIDLEETGDEADAIDTGDDTSSGVGDDADMIEADVTEFSLDGMQAYVATNFGDRPWSEEINSWGIIGESEVEVGGDLEADADEICNALVAWAAPLNADATVAVTDLAGDVTYASGTAADGC